MPICLSAAFKHTIPAKRFLPTNLVSKCLTMSITKLPILTAGHTIPYKYYDHRQGGKVYYGRDVVCRECPYRNKCITGKSKRKLILRKQNQTAYEIQCAKNDTPEYYAAMRLRQIWCEGNFSHQKANHNLKRVRTRGLGKAFMHCLLSATALNLKRMVKLLTRQLLLRKIQLFEHIYVQNMYLPLI